MKGKIKQVITWGGIIVLTIALFGFVNKQRRASNCLGTDIELRGDPEIRFVNQAEILDLLYSKGFRFEDQSLSSINLMDVENELIRHPAIKSAEAFFSPESKLMIQVDQRIPILRIMDSIGDSYYLNEDGEFMPLMDNYTARVPVASGSIFESARKINLKDVLQSDSLQQLYILDDLYVIASAAKQDSFIWCQLEQLNVLPDKEIEFIPAIGPGRVIIGDSKDIYDKFSRLELFYRQGLSQAGWNAYSALNLKYNNQIICTQNTN
ncbi:MAG: hypothetical protein WED33_00205 [Bacteroidia bacterium]